MAVKLDDLLREADALIDKHAAKKTPAAAPVQLDDVEKLAQLMVQDEVGTTKVASATAPVAFEMTPFEKIAQSIALVETLVNLEQLQKLASFEESAREKGFTEGQIDDFLEKKAADLKPVHKYITIPGALVALGAGAGNAHGKKKGYDQAMSDVSQAFSAGQ